MTKSIVINCSDGSITFIDAPEQNNQTAWGVVRTERNARLAACDWTQLPDCPLTNVKQAEWAIYRQALRDITNQTDPFNIIWPQEP